MKIIEPQVIYVPQEDPISHVAKCARICYGKDAGNDRVLNDNLILKHHWSMFRHVTYYYIVDPKEEGIINFLYTYFSGSPYINWTTGVDDDERLFIVTNGNLVLDYEKLPFIQKLMNYQVSFDEFVNQGGETVYPFLRYTMKIVTQDCIAKELNRVSPNNISEQSTRYVDLKDGVICRPHWISKEIANLYNDNDLREGITDIRAQLYLQRTSSCFDTYQELLSYGLPKQDARGVLPKDTATIVAYTYSVLEWKHIYDLRSSKRAHPNANIIANMFRDIFVNNHLPGYTILFEDESGLRPVGPKTHVIP